MINPALERCRKILFASLDPQDWRSKDAWVRRAMLWRCISLALANAPGDPEALKIYREASTEEQRGSPDEETLLHIVVWANDLVNKARESQAINEYEAKEASKLILPPGMAGAS